MSFGNPIVGGQGALVRVQIKSPNYVLNTTGWMIAKDGSAEFNNVVVRGELFVRDADGSYVRIYDDAGNAAVILLNPADLPGKTITPGELSTVSDTSGFTDSTDLVLKGPTYDGADPAYIHLGYGGGVIAVPRVFVYGDLIELFADRYISFDAPKVFVGASELFDRNLVGCARNGVSARATTSPNTDTVSAAGYVDMAGTGSVTSFTFFKRYDDSAVKLSMSGSFFTNNGGATFLAAMRVDGVDYEIVVVAATLPVSIRIPFSDFNYIDYGVLPAGSYTVQGRWQNATGVGTLTRRFDDKLSMEAEEWD